MNIVVLAVIALIAAIWFAKKKDDSETGEDSESPLSSSYGLGGGGVPDESTEAESDSGLPWEGSDTGGGSAGVSGAGLIGTTEAEGAWGSPETTNIPSAMEDWNLYGSSSEGFELPVIDGGDLWPEETMPEVYTGAVEGKTVTPQRFAVGKSLLPRKPIGINKPKVEAALNKIGLTTKEASKLLDKGYTPGQIATGAYKTEKAKTVKPVGINKTAVSKAFGKIGLTTAQVSTLLDKGYTSAQISTGRYKTERPGSTTSKSKTTMAMAKTVKPVGINKTAVSSALSKIGLTTQQVSNLLDQGYTSSQIATGKYKSEKPKGKKS